jgi:hypothetical protein
LQKNTATNKDNTPNAFYHNYRLFVRSFKNNQIRIDHYLLPLFFKKNFLPAPGDILYINSEPYFFADKISLLIN